MISDAYAKNFDLSDKRGAGKIQLEGKWSLLKQTLGMPFLFVSHKSDPNSSISITFTGIDNAALNPKSLSSGQSKYRNGRDKWALKVGVKILSFQAYKSIKNKNNITVHSIGHQYKHKSWVFDETSYYLECPKNFVHIKSLIYDKHNKLGSDAARAVESFKCK
jgi:hypothetical protein